MTLKASMLCLLLMIAYHVQAKVLQNPEVIINGKIEGKPHLSIGVELIRSFMDEAVISSQFIKTTTDDSGKFSIRFNHNKSIDFRIQVYASENGKDYLLTARAALIEPGDSIWIDAVITDTKVAKIDYSGQGFEKFQCWQKMDCLKLKENTLTASPLTIRQYIDECSAVIEQKKQILDEYRHKVPFVVFELLEADMLGEVRLDYIGYLITGFNFTGKPICPEEDKMAIAHFCEADSNNAFLAHSYPYLRYLAQQNVLNTILEKNDFNFSLADISHIIINQYPRTLRERLLFKQLVWGNRFGKSVDPVAMDSLIAHSLQYIADTAQRFFITDQLMKKARGKTCYDFRFRDSQGNVVAPRDVRGKVVVMDVWYTGCGGCVGYSQRLEKDIYPKFNGDSRVIFLSISGDKAKNTWLQSIKTNRYTRKQNLNVYTDGRGFNDPFLKYYNFNGGPYNMIVDKQGNIFAGNPPTDDMEALEKLIREALEQPDK